MNILRWFLSFIGVQLLCGALWFVGPLWPPLEEPLARIAEREALGLHHPVHGTAGRCTAETVEEIDLRTDV